MTSTKKQTGNGKTVWNHLEPAKRPYRLWDSQEKDFLPRRCYAYDDHAHDAALIETKRWRGVGESIEVVDITYWQHLGTYTRRIDAVGFLGPNDTSEKDVSHDHAE